MYDIYKYAHTYVRSKIITDFGKVSFQLGQVFHQDYIQLIGHIFILDVIWVDQMKQKFRNKHCMVPW